MHINVSSYVMNFRCMANGDISEGLSEYDVKFELVRSKRLSLKRLYRGGMSTRVCSRQGHGELHNSQYYQIGIRYVAPYPQQSD